ncbi:MAG: hypothetical protein AAGM45_13030 [Cyanobacteria bacterium J06588_5]
MSLRQLPSRKLRVRPLMYAAGALFVGVKAAIGKSGEFREWHQLQQAPIETSATVLSNQTLISSSGEVIGYELTYEFTAPGELSSNAPRSGANSQSSGSTQSAAEVQAMLEEEFWGNGESSPQSNIKNDIANGSLPETSAIEAPAPQPESIQAPTGEAFFRGEQLVKGEDYRNLNTNRPIKIMYAQNDPGNSAIVGTNASPSIAPVLIGLAAFGLGFWFLWEGVKGYFRSPALAPVNTEPTQSLATTESSRRLR